MTKNTPSSSISIERSDTGFTVLVPAGFDGHACLDMPSSSANERWNAIIGAGAKVVLCEKKLSASEIIVEDSAQLELLTIQTVEQPSHNAIKKRIILKDNAIVRLFTGLFDSVNVTIQGELLGNNAVFEHHVLYAGSGKQKIQMQLNADHFSTHTMSRTLVRGVALESSHANFAGSITMHEGADKTDAHLEHEGLLLSRNARIDALPGLNVYTDDVKAAHSSAIHYLRPDQLFYLQSRGLASDEAQQMIVRGFLQQMLSIVRDEPMRAIIDTMIQQKEAVLQ